MLKIPQAKLQNYRNWELPDVQVGFRKDRGTKIKLSTSTGSWKKQESSWKASVSALLTMPKPLTVWITTNCGNFFKRWEYQANLVSWETCMQIKKQQLELDMEQWTSSKLGKEYVKAVHCHSAYLTSMQRPSCKMPGWLNHKLELRLLEVISVISFMQMISPLWHKVMRN